MVVVVVVVKVVTVVEVLVVVVVAVVVRDTISSSTPIFSTLDERSLRSWMFSSSSTCTFLAYVMFKRLNASCVWCTYGAERFRRVLLVFG